MTNTDKDSKKAQKQREAEEKQARLAAQLRGNLRRRKVQGRERKAADKDD